MDDEVNQSACCRQASPSVGHKRDACAMWGDTAIWPIYNHQALN